jgi:hypothetical protein
MAIAARCRRLFHRLVLQRAWTAFLVLGVSFVGFGLGTLNLAKLLMLNLELVLDVGWQALMDGAARQLIELAVSGYASMAFYLVFKACEHRLVRGLAGDH